MKKTVLGSYVIVVALSLIYQSKIFVTHALTVLVFVLGSKMVFAVFQWDGRRVKNDSTIVSCLEGSHEYWPKEFPFRTSDAKNMFLTLNRFDPYL